MTSQTKIKVKVKLSDLTPKQKIQVLRRELRQECLERDYQIDVLLALFISKQHGLFLGPPGTGKSMLLELACGAIDGRFFSYLMGDSTKVEELYGAIDPNALRDKGIYKRNTFNRLPQADVAYLDEVFKGSGGLLNMNLKTINERVIYNPEPENVPLRTMVGSSNELPEDESLGAFVDRFVFKCWFDYLQHDENILELWNRSTSGHKPNIQVKLNLSDLDRLWDEVQASIQVKPYLPLLLEIKKQLALKGYAISDRKWLQVLKFLQAYAFVTKEKGTNTKVIKELLPDCIWLDPSDREDIANIVTEVISELSDKPYKLLEESDNITSTFFNNLTLAAIQSGDWEVKGIKAAIELETRLAMIEDLRKMGSPADVCDKVQEAIENGILAIKISLANKNKAYAKALILKVENAIAALEVIDPTHDINAWGEATLATSRLLKSTREELDALGLDAVEALQQFVSLADRLKVAIETASKK